MLLIKNLLKFLSKNYLHKEKKEKSDVFDHISSDIQDADFEEID